MSEQQSSETSFLIEAALRNGIVPDTNTARDAPYMLNMSNAKPTPDGAVSPEVITQPTGIGTPTYEWPWPQIAIDEGVSLLLGKTAIHTLSREDNFDDTAVTVYQAATPASTFTIVAGGPWQMVAFRDVWFASNGESFLFHIPAYNAKVFGTTAIKVKAMCAINDRLVLAGVTGTWFDGSRWDAIFDTWRSALPMEMFGHKGMAFDDGWVLYGERGGGDVAIPFYMFLNSLGIFGNNAFDDFDIAVIQSVERGEIGMCPARSSGDIRAMKQLGQRVAVYGQHAITVLEPVQNRYVDSVERWTGIHGRAAINGTMRHHVWVSPEGHLYDWVLGEGIKVIDFSSRLATSGTIVVSYDPAKDDFWISDGTYSYVYSGGALGGPMTAKPNGMFRSGTTGLIGTGIGLSSSMTMDLTTNTFGLNETGSKYITLLQAFMENLTGVEARIIKRDGWRGTYVNLPWMQFHSSGTAPIHGDAVEFRIQIRGTVSGGQGQIQGMKLWYQGNDRTYRRGTTGIQETA